MSRNTYMGRMTQSQWANTIKYIQRPKPKVARLPKLRRPKNRYEVHFMGNTYNFPAYTKSEARAMLKEALNIPARRSLPAGVVFKRVS
jgi:hypothetical protein